MNWLGHFFGALLSSRRFGVLFFFFALLFTVFARFGGGEVLPGVDAGFSPFAAPPELVAQSRLPLRRITVAPDGTIYGVVHPKFQDDNWKVVSIDPVGQMRPFPDLDWQRGVFTRPTALTLDKRGLVWVVEDHPLDQVAPRLLAFDPVKKRLVVDEEIERKLVPRGSSLADVVVSQDGAHVVIADSSAIRLSSRLIHFDIAQGQMSAKLVRHSSIRANRKKAQVDGKTFGLPLGLAVHREGANAVAFDTTGTRLFMASASSDALFSLPSDQLFFNQSPDQRGPNSIGAFVSKKATKPWSEAIVLDAAGNAFVTDAAAGQILRVSPLGSVSTLVPAGTFLWPSGLAFGPDGALYISETALHIPRWRGELAISIADVPLGIGPWLSGLIMAGHSKVSQVGVWRLDVGSSGL